ncbi:hypothetical protein O181_045970 [Austropuccinia psidii MF-1]|uniref:Uncharacterized protein n=1 Tax=Austropuccinia psidii MF-1 TaxID=1389203 RepID=A0A9Q3DSF0_9BASI|nr:hypothetical protein [Austropuccinia psidii MF-1]
MGQLGPYWSFGPPGTPENLGPGGFYNPHILWAATYSGKWTIGTQRFHSRGLDQNDFKRPFGPFFKFYGERNPHYQDFKNFEIVIRKALVSFMADSCKVIHSYRYLSSNIELKNMLASILGDTPKKLEQRNKGKENAEKRINGSEEFKLLS